jgi:hypothetical protein
VICRACANLLFKMPKFPRLYACVICNMVWETGSNVPWSHSIPVGAITVEPSHQKIPIKRRRARKKLSRV